MRRAGRPSYASTAPGMHRHSWPTRAPALAAAAVCVSRGAPFLVTTVAAAALRAV